MKIWKPFTRWTARMGKRIEHRWHADFELDCTEGLHVKVSTESGMHWTVPIVEIPPPGKRYCVHLKICLEEFPEEGGEKE